MTKAQLLEENERLRKELRRLAIVQVHRPAYGLTTVHTGYTCHVCDSGWPKRSPETHAASCLLARKGA